MAPDVHGLETGGTTPIWNNPDVHGFYGLEGVLRIQTGRRPEDEERRGESDRRHACDDESRAESFSDGPYAGGSVRPLSRLLRHQFLSKADGCGAQLEARTPGFGHGSDGSDDRGTRILRGGTSERVRRAWNNHWIGSDGERLGTVDLGDGVARGASNQLLRVLPDECRI